MVAWERIRGTTRNGLKGYRSEASLNSSLLVSYTRHDPSLMISSRPPARRSTSYRCRYVEENMMRVKRSPLHFFPPGVTRMFHTLRMGLFGQQTHKNETDRRNGLLAPGKPRGATQAQP